MCCTAILLRRISHLVIGENKTFQGEEKRLKSRHNELTVLNDPSCMRRMADFIQAYPQG
jgi:cytosine/creatinine deaminase